MPMQSSNSTTTRVTPLQAVISTALLLAAACVGLSESTQLLPPIRFMLSADFVWLHLLCGDASLERGRKWAIPAVVVILLALAIIAAKSSALPPEFFTITLLLAVVHGTRLQPLLKGAQRAVLFAAIAAVAVKMLNQSLPHVYLLTIEGCQRLTGWLTGLLLNTPTRIGPTYIDLSLMLFYAAYCLFAIWHLGPDGRRRQALIRIIGWLALLVLVVLAYGGAARLHELAPVAQRHPRQLFDVSRGAYQNLVSYAFRGNFGIAVTACMILIETATVWLSRKELRKELDRPVVDNELPTRRQWVTGIVVGTICCGFAIFAAVKTRPEPVQTQTAPRIFIHDPEGAWLRDPTDEVGGRRAGFFSGLPEFLTAAGYQVTVGDYQEKKEVPGNVDLVVLINLRSDFSPESTQRIREFVRNGKSLLCLADHTGFKEIRLPFNRVLQETGISVNFDSAVPFDHWSTSLLVFPEALRPASSRAGFWNELTSIGVGASLTVEQPARPVIVGRRGFSDPGDFSRSGNLGNLSYDFGEPAGDLVLAAETGWGSGRVLVFGDTSSFQTTALCFSHRFALQVLAYLTGTNRPSFPPPLAALAIGLFVALLLDRRSPAGVALIMLFGSLILTFHNPGQAASGLSGLAVRPTVDAGQFAILDRSHHPRYPGFAGVDRGIGGLALAIERRHMTLLHCFENLPAQLKECRLCVLASPQAPFTNEEQHALDEFLKTGGDVLVSIDAEHYPNLQGFLEPLGITLSDTPLGEFVVESGFTRESIHFVSAWPVRCSSEHKTLAAAWGHDVVVEKRVGDGRLIVIGDGRWLTESNLEGTRSAPRPENVRFLRALLAGSAPSAETSSGSETEERATEAEESQR